MKKTAKKDTDKVKCEDCGVTYKEGAPHYMFCRARTCSSCLTTYGYVIPVYDSRKKPPERRCEKCMDNEEDDE